MLYLVWALMGLNISICLYYLLLHVKHVLSDLNKLCKLCNTFGDLLRNSAHLISDDHWYYLIQTIEKRYIEDN